MFQKFYTDTLGSRYIKSLLAQTPIPLFDCVVDGDHLVEGYYYVYDKFIIKCNTSGILAVDVTDTLYPSDNLYPSIYLYPGNGYRGATFYVISYADVYDVTTHRPFVSSTNYYDPDTHYHLSRYLRYILTTQKLNLFPFYNFYSSNYLNDVLLDKNSKGEVTISRATSTKYKVAAIPILFGKTYTVALDCGSEVLIRGCIHDNTGYVDESTLPKPQDSGTVSILSVLENSGKVYTRMNFHKPITFRMELNDPKAMYLQRNLYMLIQLPVENDSSIVVLENFENTMGVVCDVDHEESDTATRFHNNVRKYSVWPSLLKMNTKVSFAFSDRLFEYLIGNVISHTEILPNNIKNVQRSLSNLFPYYKDKLMSGKLHEGVWDDSIPSLVGAVVEKLKTEDNQFYDQDGNINKDVEILLQRGKY